MVKKVPARSQAEMEVEEDQLRSSLTSLAQLSTDVGLEELLTKVAPYAVRAIPGADGAGLT